MRSIDNVFHAVSDALAEHVDLSRVAITAWHEGEVLKLDAAIACALGSKDAETTVDDMIPGAIVGAVNAIMGEYTRDTRNLFGTDDALECEDEYVDLIRRASDTASEGFLRQARVKIRAALRLSVAARLDCMTLEDRYQRTPIKESLSFVSEVADYYRDYKQQCHLMDSADILASEVNAIEACALCFVDPTRLPLLGWQGLRRLFPRAFFCVCSVDSR